MNAREVSRRTQRRIFNRRRHRQAVRIALAGLLVLGVLVVLVLSGAPPLDSIHLDPFDAISF